MKFGHPVTSIFVKNSQKRKNAFFGSFVIAEENGALVIAPFFWQIKTSVKFEKNSWNTELLSSKFLLGIPNPLGEKNQLPRQADKK